MQVDPDGTILYPESVTLKDQGFMVFDSLLGPRQIAVYRDQRLLEPDESESLLIDDEDISVGDYRFLENFCTKLHEENLEMRALLDKMGIKYTPKDSNELTPN